MVVNRKPTGTAKSMPMGLLVGWGISMLMTVLLCGLLAGLILSGKTGWEAMGYGAIGILLAASYVGSGVSCRLIMHRKLLVCILSGIIYLCSLAAITALLFGGKYEGIWLSALLVAGGVGASALVHCAEKRDGGRRRKKRRL